MTDSGRVVEGVYAGWRSLSIEGSGLRVTILPDKGGEIVELVDAASGLDVLFHAPWGLQPPGSAPREGSDGHTFLENYGGGWQTLRERRRSVHVSRPNGPLPRRGRRAALAGRATRAGVRPADRVMPADALPAGAGDAAHRGARSRHRGDGREPIGHAGPSRLGPSLCRRAAVPRPGLPAPRPGGRDRDGSRDVGGDRAPQPGQRSPWPHGQLRVGGTADLREVPGPEAREATTMST